MNLGLGVAGRGTPLPKLKPLQKENKKIFFFLKKKTDSRRGRREGGEGGTTQTLNLLLVRVGGRVVRQGVNSLSRSQTHTSLVFGRG